LEADGKNSAKPSTSFTRRLLQVALLGAYAYFCFLMLLISLQYIPWNTDVAFLRIKQDYIGFWYYEAAFFIHVFTAPLCLIAGFTQFSKTIRQRFPKIHRWSGWLYVVSVIGFAAPSGLVMGIYANGGWPSQIAFCLLGLLWFAFTVLAVKATRVGNFMRHRDMMMRSFALALSAITLRAWKWVLVALLHPRPMDVYMVVAWLGWTLNLLVAEFLIFRLKK
jgi:uncharacterized membrane protein